MDYLTAEELLNYQPKENRLGDSLSGGAAQRLFTSGGGEYSSEDEDELNNRVNTYERQQFLAGFVTPNKRRSSEVNMLNARFLSTRKETSRDMLTSAKRIKDIQQSVFTPSTKLPRHAGQVLRAHEMNLSQPKVLNLMRDQAVDSEVLRSKRNLISNGPPMLPDDPTVSQFCEWRAAIVNFLTLVPGFQKEMLEIPPNLEGISDQHFRSIVDRYELIYNLLNSATNKNQLVRLKTNDIEKDPICDVVSWWAIVLNQFQPSDVQIKLLREKYTACVQKDGQTGTKYLQEVEQKADELRKLGEIYDTREIGNKVYEGLNFQLQQFVYTNFMAQNIVCDSSSISVLLKNFEDMQARDSSNSKLAKPMNAFMTTSVQNPAKINSDKIIFNNHSRGNHDYDNSAMLQNLPDSLPVKRDKGYLSGPRGKLEKSD
jgi:hypothetical protein